MNQSDLCICGIERSRHTPGGHGDCRSFRLASHAPDDDDAGPPPTGGSGASYEPDRPSFTADLGPIKVDPTADAVKAERLRQRAWLIVEALGDSPESDALAAFLNRASASTLILVARMGEDMRL